MNEPIPARRSGRASPGRDRIVVVLVAIVFVALLWAARSGRYDREVGVATAWLQRGWADLVTAVRDLGD